MSKKIKLHLSDELKSAIEQMPEYGYAQYTQMQELKEQPQTSISMGELLILVGFGWLFGAFLGLLGSFSIDGINVPMWGLIGSVLFFCLVCAELFINSRRSDKTKEDYVRLLNDSEWIDGLNEFSNSTVPDYIQTTHKLFPRLRLSCCYPSNLKVSSVMFFRLVDKFMRDNNYRLEVEVMNAEATVLRLHIVN